tara:strand:- start:1373 stop:2839 length:1467 start_codon:yes stop_codon:yes gene_type:complete
MKRISKKSPITLVELPATQFGALNGEISFNEFSKSKLPLRAVHVLEAILRNEGWENVKSISSQYHGKNGKLTSKNFKRIFDSDVLLASYLTSTYSQTNSLFNLYKQNNPNGIAVAGGFDATFRTKEALENADIVVRGEGEKTLVELINRLTTKDYNDLEDIDGLAFKNNGEIIFTKKRKLLTPEELSNLPHPYYDEETRKGVLGGVIETSRGCPNDCDFCTVTEFNGRKYRTRSIDYVIEELKRIDDLGRYIFYTDDNFIGSPTKTINLLEAIADKGLNKKVGLAQTTVKLADNPKLMNVMKKAGINFLCIGLESINDESLEGLGKPYNAEQNKRAVRIFKEYGFWTHGMMIFGLDGDTKEGYKETISWMNKKLDSMQLFPIVPGEGTRFHKRMQEENRILSNDLSLYDGHHVLVRPKNFTPYELQKMIIDCYEDFYSVENNLKRIFSAPNKRLALGLMVYTNLFGGVRKVTKSPQMKDHLEFLKSIS